MKNPITFPRVLCGAVLLAAALPVAGADTTRKFSDPSKPGRVIVQLAFGDVSVVGEDTDEVRISSDLDEEENQPRDDGFRRLDGESGFSAGESGNVITVTFANFFPGKHGKHTTDVSLVVPRATSVTIERSGPGDLEVRGLAGDLEIHGAIGDVELVDMSGGVLVEAVNGDIEASFTALAPERPVSLSVVHGDVSVSVPEDARADVQLRTLRGEMITNFGEDRLKTRFENKDWTSGSDNDNDNENEDLEQAKRDAEQAKRDAEQARRDAEKQRRDAERDARRNAQNPPSPGNVPMPPMPPMVSVNISGMPPMAGGKLVVGQLNGGGTELSVATITGDITLQKAE